MKKFLLGMLVCLLPVVLVGCHACSEPLKLEENKVASKEPADRFAIDLASIFKIAPSFVYTSDLSISMGQGDRHHDNREEIRITANQPAMLLSKKIDQFHFFELFKDNDDFLIKNLNGPWKRGLDSKSMYRDLIDEGINLTAWLVRQLGLEGQFKEDSSSKLWVVAKSINPRVPFIKEIERKYVQFRSLKSSHVEAGIAFLKQSAVPTSATFDITINGQEGYWLKLTAKMTLLFRDVTVLRPTVANSEPMAMPVNVARRFNELMNLNGEEVLKNDQ